MATVLLILLIFVTLAMIGVVLIQRSEGGGLGIGSSQGMGSFMTGRGTANLLTRATAILASLFFALCLALALLNRGTAGVGHSILDVPPAPGAQKLGAHKTQAAPALPALPADRVPTTPAAPPTSPAPTTQAAPPAPPTH